MGFGVISLQVNALINDKIESYKSSIQFTTKKYFTLLLGFVVSLLITIGGLVLLFIPGVIVLFILPFVKFHILFEEKSVWSAVKNSFSLVWGNWWRTFFVTFIPMLIPIIILLYFNLCCDYSKNQLTNIYAYFISPFIAIFVTPLFEVLLINQYYDLKHRKLIKTK